MGFPGDSVVKNPAMQETWVKSLGQEDPLQKGMATHSSIRAWRIPWKKEPGGLHGVSKSQDTHTNKVSVLQSLQLMGPITTDINSHEFGMFVN